MSSALLPVLFAGWYACSFFTDVFNKQIQEEVRIPLLLTAVQFLAGGILATLLLKLSRSRGKAQEAEQNPGGDPQQVKQTSNVTLRDTLGVSLCWCIGFATTNISLGAVQVAHTHTIKAAEPLFLVVIATIFFGRKYTLGVWLSLIPIVVGIVLVAATDLSLSWLGFLSACTSNCCFVLRSILAKDVIARTGVDNLTLFSYVSWTALALTLPFAVLFEGDVLIAAFPKMTPTLAWLFLGNGVLHYSYNQLSMTILSMVPALTHSIGNASRRFVIIIGASLYRGKTMTQNNIIGIALLAVGVAGYVWQQAKNNAAATAPSSTSSTSAAGREKPKSS